MPPIDSETTHWFTENVRPLEGSLRAYLRSSLSSDHDVDDVLQDTYTRVLRERERTTVGSAKALLFAVARNAVRDLIRHRTVVRHEAISEWDSSPAMQDQTNVVELVSRRQELALLAAAIRDLPTRCREVLILRKMQGMPQREIARRLGISENTVETLVARGTRHCRDFLNAAGANGGIVR